MFGTMSELVQFWRSHIDTKDRLFSRMEKRLDALMTCWIQIVFLLNCLPAISKMAAAERMPEKTGWQFQDRHNYARQSLGLPFLLWNTTLADHAQAWADIQASPANKCTTMKRSGGPYGENLYYSQGVTHPNRVVDAWTAEQTYYDYSTNTCATGKYCGHYLQVIWKQTTQVGCGMATCPFGGRPGLPAGGIFYVCSYSPPGNINGQKPY